MSDILIFLYTFQLGCWLSFFGPFGLYTSNFLTNFPYLSQLLVDAGVSLAVIAVIV